MGGIHKNSQSVFIHIKNELLKHLGALKGLPKEGAHGKEIPEVQSHGLVERKKGGSTMRRTKIVCTIGPSSSSHGMLETLIRSGMDCGKAQFFPRQP